jgi:hypothetical protein
MSGDGTEGHYAPLNGTQDAKRLVPPCANDTVRLCIFFLIMRAFLRTLVPGLL